MKFLARWYCFGCGEYHRFKKRYYANNFTYCARYKEG